MKSYMSLWIVSWLIVFLPFFGTVHSQTEQCAVGDTVCTLDSTSSAAIDMQRIEKFGKHFDDALSSQEWEKVRELTVQFLSSDIFHTHIAVNLAAALLPHEELLDLAEQVIKKGIEENTVENLRRLDPVMASEHQQKLELGRLYSQYAWILWKRDQLKEALTSIEQAMGYFASTGTPTAVDKLRLGIIEYENGRKQQGWENVAQALLMDTLVENQDPEYAKALGLAVRDRYGKGHEPKKFVSEFRKQHAEIMPVLPLAALNGTRIEPGQQKGKVLFVNFFSPKCNSCRQEIQNLGQLHAAFSTTGEVIFLFVLNQPDLRQEALALLEQSGIPQASVVVFENGSPYDLIPAEPTIWIADRTGKIIFRHAGYEKGDEQIYRQKLTELIQSKRLR